MSHDDQSPWGRVDDDGTVYVRLAEGERPVGQYPDATPDEALAYFTRKFVELEGQVSLLEQRARRGASPSDIAKAAATLQAAVAGANAVGDLESLTTRLAALQETLGELTEKQSAEAKAAVERAIAERTAIVVQAETLAAGDLSRVQWKQLSAQFDELFASWQQHQQSGPRLPKSESNELWKRFRDARSTVETARKAFYAELDSAHREVRAAKQRLIERAEALAPQGAAAIGTYRDLLEEWKGAGRAGKKADDALWARFKAAGDVLFAAKAEVDAQESVEFSTNLELKLEVLTDAERLLTEKDRTKARERLSAIQRRWDEIGKVPRDQIRTIEDRLRTVETHVRKLEDEHWKRSDPEKQARSTGLASQLTAAIDKLEAELAEATAAKDAKRIAEIEEALAARRVWLDAIGS